MNFRKFNSIIFSTILVLLTSCSGEPDVVNLDNISSLENLVSKLEKVSKKNCECVQLIGSGVWLSEQDFSVSPFLSLHFKTIDLSRVEGLTRIPDLFFYNLHDLQVVYLPEAVKEIGARAFKSCTSLTKVPLANILRIGDSAFDGCNSILLAVMPNTISIGSYAFANCEQLYLVECPKAEELESYAFYNCMSLTEANVENVSQFDSSVFESCASLEKIVYSDEMSSRIERIRQNKEIIEAFPMAYLPGVAALAREMYVSSYEVTNEMWDAVMWNEENCNSFEEHPNPRCPVVNVSYDEVQEFLKRLNNKTGKEYRLPSREEWLYFAEFDLGYDDCELCDIAVFGTSGLSPVGSKKPSCAGLYDLLGNAWEFVDSGSANDVAVVGGAYCSEAEILNFNDSYGTISRSAQSPIVGFRIIYYPEED